MELNELKTIIDKVLEAFYTQDKELLNYNTYDTKVCERCISSRLAIYLQKEFELLNVDCEYNRHINDYKTVNKQKIYPDIIIHKRKVDNYNLAWIEVKKNTSEEKKIEEDRKRLKFVTNSAFKYNYGILIILADELKAVKIEYYSSGIKLGSD